MLSVVRLSVVITKCYAECRQAECRYAECRQAECCYDECRQAECRYAECRQAECRYAECSTALITPFVNYCYEFLKHKSLVKQKQKSC